jgi:hypothetical protein
MSNNLDRTPFRITTEEYIGRSIRKWAKSEQEVLSLSLRSAPFLFFSSDSPMSVIAYRMTNSDRYTHVHSTPTSISTGSSRRSTNVASGKGARREPVSVESIVAFIVDWHPFGHAMISMDRNPNNTNQLREHARMNSTSAEWMSAEIQGRTKITKTFSLEPSTADRPSTRDCVVQFDDLSMYQNVSYPSIYGKWIYNPTILDVSALFATGSSETLAREDDYVMCARASWASDSLTGPLCERLAVHEDQVSCLWDAHEGASWIHNAATVCGRLDPVSCKVDYTPVPKIQTISIFDSSWQGGRGWHDTRIMPLWLTKATNSSLKVTKVTKVPFAIITSLIYETMDIDGTSILVKLPSAVFINLKRQSQRLTKMLFYDPTNQHWSGADAIREHVCSHRNTQNRTNYVPSLPSTAHIKDKGTRIAIRNTYSDKNWASFVYQNRVLWSHHIRPHVVCENDINLLEVHDACAICIKQYETKGNDTLWQNLEIYAKKRMLRMAPQQHLPHEIHASMDIHLSGCATYFVPTRNVYLGVLHAVVSAENQDEHVNYLDYQQYFYLLEPEPPFAVIGISCEIDLIKLGSMGNMWFRYQYRSVSFITGFQYIPEDVGSEFLISYGVGDYISAIKRLSEQDVFDSFSCV